LKIVALASSRNYFQKIIKFFEKKIGARKLRQSFFQKILALITSDGPVGPADVMAL
jgi:hypothetical protein